MVKEFFIPGIFIICKLNCVEDECQFLTNCSLNNEERNTFFGVFVHNISIFILETFKKKIILNGYSQVPLLHYITSKLTVYIVTS